MGEAKRRKALLGDRYGKPDLMPAKNIWDSMPSHQRPGWLLMVVFALSSDKPGYTYMGRPELGVMAEFVPAAKCTKSPLKKMLADTNFATHRIIAIEADNPQFVNVIILEVARLEEMRRTCSLREIETVEFTVID